MRALYLLPLLETSAVAATALMVPLLASNFASLFEIGTIGAAYGLANFISYFYFGRRSDNLGRRRPFIKAGLAASAVAALLHLAMHDVASALLARAALGFAVGIYYFPLVAYLGAMQGFKQKLGAFMGASALGWSLGTLLAGLLGGASAFLAASLLFAAGLALSFALPAVRYKGLAIPRFPRAIIRKNARIYLAFLLRHSGAHAVWIIFPLFLQQLGASMLLIGVIYALNTLGQFFVMNWLGRFLEQRDETRFIQLGYVLSGSVFLLYYIAPNPYFILPVQLILATGWSFVWLGSIIQLSAHNAEQATSTGILGSMSGLAQAFGPLLGGAVAQLYGFHAVFLLAAALCLLPFAISRKL
ncbi:MAG: MFS transporter [Candidatus Aenigmarchaeota archaeon]|nr:MFS transporter [Candidatus Aenigmarchaeota archaeon]